MHNFSTQPAKAVFCLPGPAPASEDLGGETVLERLGDRRVENPIVDFNWVRDVALEAAHRQKQRPLRPRLFFSALAGFTNAADESEPDQLERRQPWNALNAMC